MNLRVREGVTLTELMIVIVIIGIAAALAVPGMTSWMAKNELKAEARKLYSVFQHARSEAIRNNRNVAVGIVFGEHFGDSYYCSWVGTYSDWNQGNPAVLITPKTPVPKNIKITKSDDPRHVTLTSWEYLSDGSFYISKKGERDCDQPITLTSSVLTWPDNEKNFTFTQAGAVIIK